MRHFTQRLMMVVMATFMAVGSLWAYSELPKSGPFTSAYYDYVAAETGTLVFHVTNNADWNQSPAVYYDVVNFYDASASIPSKGTRDINVPVYAGKNTFWLNSVSDCTYTLTEPGGAGGSDGPDDVSGAGTQDSPYIIELGKKMPCGGASDYIYYKYTATSAGRLMFDMSKVSGSTSVGYNTISMTLGFDSWSYDYQSGISLSAGQSAYIFIGYSANNSENYVKFSFAALQEGDAPSIPFNWAAGDYNYIRSTSAGQEIWYKVQIPAGKRLDLEVNTFYGTGATFVGYSGLSDANSKNNGTERVNGTSLSFTLTYSNTSASDIDYYICQSGDTYGSTGYASISFANVASPTDAKSIGSFQFDVNDMDRVPLSRSTILLNFPTFQKGDKADYNLEVTYSIYPLNSSWAASSPTSGYYHKVVTGTLTDGVVLPLPTLTNNQRYLVEVNRVNVTDGNLAQDFTYDNSVKFQASNIPDGSEGNPFIITAAGVAGPKAVGYGSYVWYKYVVPMDGVVTISRTWDDSKYTTLGQITVNGSQVRANVPASWSGSCHMNDVILVKISAVSDLTGFLVKGSTAAPGPGQSRDTAIDLTPGSNTIALVANGALSNWYKFTVEANYQGTLTFSDGIAANYYIGASESGMLIGNNSEGHSELKYDNESASEEVIFIEVTGTNDKAQTANLSFKVLGFADCDADVAESGENITLNVGGAKNGENVSGPTELTAMSRDFELTFNMAGFTHVENGVRLTMPDGSDIASKITNWDFDCDKVTFSLNSDISDDDLLTGGTWTLVIKEDAFLGGDDDIYCEETTVSWKVEKAEVYNAPTILSATNGDNAAGETVSEISSVFEITLSEASRWAGYGVQYQYDDVAHGTASVSMSADKKTATITITGADEYLSKNGEHKLYITVGAFVNANDELKGLAASATFTWTRNAAETYPLNIYEDFASMYWDKNWTVESGVEVYYGVWNSEYSCIDLYQYTGSVVPANQGVMVRSIGAETTVLTATDEEPNGTMEGNQFKGTVAPAGVYRNTSMTTYVYTKSGVFARYTGEMIPAYRAYMELVSGVAPASARMRIVNTTTDIEGVDANVNVQKQMINGQLFIIRDGKMYNVQGVLVK